MLRSYLPIAVIPKPGLIGYILVWSLGLSNACINRSHSPKSSPKEPLEQLSQVDGGKTAQPSSGRSSESLLLWCSLLDSRAIVGNLVTLEEQLGQDQWLRHDVAPYLFVSLLIDPRLAPVPLVVPQAQFEWKANEAMIAALDPPQQRTLLDLIKSEVGVYAGLYALAKGEDPPQGSKEHPLVASLAAYKTEAQGFLTSLINEQIQLGPSLHQGDIDAVALVWFEQAGKDGFQRFKVERTHRQKALGNLVLGLAEQNPQLFSSLYYPGLLQLAYLWNIYRSSHISESLALAKSTKGQKGGKSTDPLASNDDGMVSVFDDVWGLDESEFVGEVKANQSANSKEGGAGGIGGAASGTTYKKFKGNKPKLGRLLGQGSIADVYELKSGLILKDSYAAKKFRESQSGFQDEVNNMERVSGHRAFPKFKGVWTNEGDNYIVMERIASGLSESFATLATAEAKQQAAKKWLIQAIEGLHYLHFQGLAHGDITALNLRVDSKGDLRIIDLGRTGPPQGNRSLQSDLKSLAVAMRVAAFPGEVDPQGPLAQLLNSAELGYLNLSQFKNRAKQL